MVFQIPGFLQNKIPQRDDQTYQLFNPRLDCQIHEQHEALIRMSPRSIGIATRDVKPHEPQQLQGLMTFDASCWSHLYPSPFGDCFLVMSV